MQEKTGKMHQNYSFAIIFTFSQQIRSLQLTYIIIPKTFVIIKKDCKKKLEINLFSLSSRFPFLQLFIYRYAIIKKSRFHRDKTAKIWAKIPLYLIYIVYKCLKMYKLHYLIYIKHLHICIIFLKKYLHK